MIDVFRREKFDKYISLKERLDFLDSFIRSAILIEAPKLPKPVCRDPKDDKYLALAIAAQSKIIVTGDTDLLVLNPYKGITIINSFDFLHQYVEYSKK